MTTQSGKFRSNSSFVGMIENLGDAYEAAEECFGMVQLLAHTLELASGPDGYRPMPHRSRQEWIEWACANYMTGLKIGKVQRNR